MESAWIGVHTRRETRNALSIKRERQDLRDTPCKPPDRYIQQWKSRVGLPDHNRQLGGGSSPFKVGVKIYTWENDREDRKKMGNGEKKQRRKQERKNEDGLRDVWGMRDL